VNVGNNVYTPYGNEDEPIEAGDWAPDAPNLVLAPTTTTLFDLLAPFSHTVLVFELPDSSPPMDTKPPSRPASTIKDHLDGRGGYDGDGHRLVDSYPVLPENTPNVGSGRAVEDVNWVLVHTQGHAWRTYNIDTTQTWKPFPLVIVIRPNTYIGAFAHDTQGGAIRNTQLGAQRRNQQPAVQNTQTIQFQAVSML
ncbi:hypothetical protein BS47DRAFT_1433461, partial [Hydnum rufescens UP504]